VTNVGPTPAAKEQRERRPSRASSGGLAPARVAPWLLVVTGVGLRGRREDALLARAASIFDGSVPVVHHRYGVFRSGALFRWCQRIATARLAERIRSFAGTGPPDVLAHSFGAWLVGQALRDNPDLRVGRVVLAGSVLRPDFDWGSLIRVGRVEAMLNHCGQRDLWAWASEYFIPDSGPSGRRGCMAEHGVVNHAAPGFRHRTYFAARRIDEVHQELWQPFLTFPEDELGRLGNRAGDEGWRPPPWLLRANLARAVVILAAAVGILAAAVGAVVLALWLAAVVRSVAGLR
jgi:pimeloyl-ACP methyl ester carboxylesterase